MRTSPHGKNPKSHLQYPTDIRNVNFKALKAAGIEAIVFDKDNTVTAPYVDTVHPPFERAWVGCKNVFGTNRMLIVSNSAGTPDDAEYKKVPHGSPQIVQCEMCQYHS